MTKNTNQNILLIPNEDGFGPSALMSYIARALLASPGIRLTIWNKSRCGYNRSLLADTVKEGRANVLPVWGLIQLDKKKGEVSIPGTLRRIGDYRYLSNHYPFNPRQKVLDFATDNPACPGQYLPTAFDPNPGQGFDLVIDFGVPAAARWAVKRGLKSVTVFDHSWSKTLQMILEKEDNRQKSLPGLSGCCRAAWHSLIDEIRKDEEYIEHLFLFPRFISPDLFYRHWRTLLSESSIHEMTCVLGGNIDTKAAEKRLTDAIGDLPTEDTETILIQAGDTPVWDGLLPRIAQGFIDNQQDLRSRDLLIVIYVPDRLKKDRALARIMTKSPQERIRGFHCLRGETIQGVLPAFNLLVTRAGGGSVNDAVACRIPFVCVEEGSQAQVEAILKACEQRGLTRRLHWQAFVTDPKGAILAEYELKEENARIRSEMEGIEPNGENMLIEEIKGII